MPRDGPISILPWDEQMGAGGRCALIPRMRLLWLSRARFRPRGGGGPSLREEPAAQNLREQRPATNAGSLESGVWRELPLWVRSGGQVLSSSWTL